MLTSRQNVSLPTEVRLPCLSKIELSSGSIIDIMWDCLKVAIIFSNFSLNFEHCANAKAFSAPFRIGLHKAFTQIRRGSLRENNAPTLLLLMSSLRRSSDDSIFFANHRIMSSNMRAAPN